MKKLFTIALSLVLTFSLAACGCQAEDTLPPTTVPIATTATTVPTTAVTTVPTTTATMPMDPTIETNIPDPSVESNSTVDTEPTMDSTTENTGEMNSRIRMKTR